MSAKRILPIESDHDTGAVFAAAREHRLVVRSCSRCGADHHLPRAYCYHCGSFDLAWREVAGLGTLYAWTVVEHPTHPAYEVPYTVVLVDVDEAPDVRLVGNLPGRPTLEVGMPMEVWWDDVDGQAVLPNWRPARLETRALTEGHSDDIELAPG